MEPGPLIATAGMLIAVGVLYLTHMRDERRWKRELDEEQRRRAAAHPAE